MSKPARLRAIKIACATLLVVATEAHSQGSASDTMAMVSSVSTTALATACQRSQLSGAADFCSGYILGAYDALSSSRFICPADTATTGQALAVARKFLQDHPERWGEHPSALMLSAFKAAFPCRNQ